jgi:predicted esterase
VISTSRIGEDAVVSSRQRILLLLALGAVAIGVALRLVLLREPDAPTPKSDLVPLVPAVVQSPRGVAPREGWPTMVLLHGAGSSGARFMDFAAAVSDAGIAAIVPTGTRQEAAGHYVWESDVELLDRFLTSAIDAAALSLPIDRNRLMIGGYSQGAGLAIAIAARNPDVYRGVLAVAPLGPATVPVPKVEGATVALALIHGRNDAAATDASDSIRVVWGVRRWPIVEHATYDGSHSLPPAWPRLVTSAATKLRER